MGVSIDIYQYSWNEIFEAINAIAQDPVEVEKALLEFGTRFDDAYLILHNEYYEEYNAHWEVREFFERRYGIPDDLWYKFSSNSLNANKSCYCVEQELGIDLDEIEDERKSSVTEKIPVTPKHLPKY